MRPRLPNSVVRILSAPRIQRRVLMAAAGAVLLAALAAFLAVLLMRESGPADHPVVAAGHRLVPAPFAEIPGWAEDEPSQALAAFRRSCRVMSGQASGLAAMSDACEQVAALSPDEDAAGAQTFFERHFQAYRIELQEGAGLLTAYYEPVIDGSRTRSDHFAVPIYGLPRDHVRVADGNRPEGFDVTLTAARATRNGLFPWPTRGEIDAGALEGLAEPLVWIADPVDAFFIHIQGSSRIALPDGEMMRIGFAGRNGHPYTSVGSVMMERDIRPVGGLSMDGMRGFFRDNPETARALMHENRSFIFFRIIDGLDPDLGPIGAQGVPLTTQRSLAVDPAFHALGTPIFIEAELPIGPDRMPQAFRRLMIAQDTGSAIKGPARGDLFWGTGAQAGSVAGGIKAPGNFYVLLPRGG